jgi:hypothetical protein
LALNSLYGKTIQKPIDKELKFIKGEEARKAYRERHNQQIIDHALVEGSEDLWVFNVTKSIADFSNHVLLGSHILAMSKRIMNEVMCKAEVIAERKHIELDMFYQDTDSFFIGPVLLEDLKSEFKDKYGYKLVGKNMG